MKSRNCARLTIAHVVGSIVTTDADRGVAVERHLAHVLAGPVEVDDDLAPRRVARVHLHAA